MQPKTDLPCNRERRAMSECLATPVMPDVTGETSPVAPRVMRPNLHDLGREETGERSLDKDYHEKPLCYAKEVRLISS